MSHPPAVAAWFQKGFHAFLRPFVRRHFHTIAIHSEGLERLAAIGDVPLIVYGNHASWWDPLVAHLLCRHCFPRRQFYAPIDARALDDYRVFKKLGFYGVELNTRRGAVDFLGTSLGILRHPGTSLWITPEGRFADVRDYAADLMPGLAHLCSRMPEGGVALPLAIEYVFWEERLPECLIRFGTPIRCGEFHSQKAQGHPVLADALRANQRMLAADVIARRPDAFQPMISGARGAGGVYDVFRRLRSWASGKAFRAEHGRKFH